jgi:dihydrofolate synthase/folylpolyglutamate synthase
VIFDVAHNPDAIAKLREFLDESVVRHPTVAVFGVMSDKDCYRMISILDSVFDLWCLPQGIGGARGMDPEAISAMIPGVSAVFESFPHAWSAALHHVGDRGRIVVFGSFFTVGEGMRVLSAKPLDRLRLGL